MIRAAMSAARSLASDFAEVDFLQVSRKGPADFVSQADIKAESIIIESLKKVRPDVPFLAEEMAAEDPALASKSPADFPAVWIVDPLDGTTNFLHGLPHWAISIAYAEKGQVLAGVIFDPIKDELFAAARGQGVHVNRRRVRSSQRNELADCIFATGIPFLGRGDAADHARFNRELAGVMEVSAGVRRFGAASLDLAYVAAGRYDGFWERGLSVWDVAAGVLMVEESGGKVTDFSGSARQALKGDIVAAPGRLHRKLTHILSQAAE